MHRHKTYEGRAGKENISALDATIFHTAETVREKTKEKDKEKWGGPVPRSPVVKNLPSNAGAAGSIPDGGTKIPHVSLLKNQNEKQKQYCNKFNKQL